MGSKPRILIVDDSRLTVKLIERVLHKAGFEVLTAFDGKAGLQKAREAKPDLIVLDIMMPKMDGYEVCRHLQANPDTANIGVLILTAKGDVDNDVGQQYELAIRVQDRLQGFDAGAVEFLSKPVKAKELVKRVKAVLCWGSDI